MNHNRSTRTHGRYSTHYLIHTHYSHRPYYTNVPFFAADLERWGYRVDAYPYGAESPWLKEHFKKNERIRPFLLWAREVIKQDRQQRDGEGEQRADDDVGSVLKDFIRGLVQFDSPSYHYPNTNAHIHHLKRLGYPTPPSTPAVLTFYNSLLRPLGIQHNAPKPRMVPYPCGRLDCVILEFKADENRMKELLEAAMKFAAEARPGRFGELTDRTPLIDLDEHGTIFVRLYVTVQGEPRGHGDEENAMEELPAYVGEEEGAQGELPPSYDQIVVREPAETSRIQPHSNCK
ncbi:hypothetical protein P171DRAFT_492765 [Karstenula rhodostoma CBS 690.94]|uniref:Uncharacterized protein n=1 Tax=Karstenula rhodostoma CBS 690.94 TaxID=1392251 RepID=A0A9P4PVW8_9PLEO|nr:hypothetical protein P171DRAFT_492765 [Karstenula rhodostoma CBS 690.94]